jgi:hypothetical protein
MKNSELGLGIEVIFEPKRWSFEHSPTKRERGFAATVLISGLKHVIHSFSQIGDIEQ